MAADGGRRCGATASVSVLARCPSISTTGMSTGIDEEAWQRMAAAEEMAAEQRRKYKATLKAAAGAKAGPMSKSTR